MSWLQFHTQSEQYVSQAEASYQRRELIAAKKLYRLAADAEVEALNSLDSSKTRTLGITVVSAASLYFKAQDFEQSKKIARKWLESEILPPFAIKELKDLLLVIAFTKSLFSQPLLNYKNSQYLQSYSLPLKKSLHNKKILNPDRA